MARDDSICEVSWSNINYISNVVMTYRDNYLYICTYHCLNECIEIDFMEIFLSHRETTWYQFHGCKHKYDPVMMLVRKNVPLNV